MNITEALALPEVARLVESNKRLEAMKVIRTLTGCDLQTARDAVGTAPPMPEPSKWVEVAPGLWEPEDQAKARHQTGEDL